MSRHVTIEDWKGSFEDCCSPGDTVDEKIVDHFLNCVTPASMKPGYVQCGEPYSHNVDDRTGRLRPTYATFLEREGDGEWVYCGNCFHGEIENRPESGDPWNK